MRSKHSIVQNTLLLTGVELLLRAISMLFQRELAARIGAAGIGLLQLVLSVGGFAMTLGLSGLRVCAMYLCAEEYGRGCPGGMRQVMGFCLRVGALISSVVGLALWLLSDYAAARWIADPRAGQALRLLALFLPVNCLCAILSGFFTACDRVPQLAKIETIERLGAIALTFLLLRFWAGTDTRRACSAMILGSALACLASTLWQLGLYRRICRGFTPAPKDSSLGQRVWKLCAPLALSAYLRSGLSTLEQLLIPWGLAKNAATAHSSMVAYGTIHGMVFPVLMLPAAILYTLGDLLVPELARCRAEENTRRIRRLTKICLRMGLIFSLGVACLMAALSGALGQLLYKSQAAGHYLLVFSPMLVMLYMDAMVDGMLKGLGEQVACVRYNTLTSFLDILLLYLLLPRGGVGGYVLTFFVTHALNFYLSCQKLFCVTGLHASGAFLLRALFCALSAFAACFCIPSAPTLLCAALRAGSFLSVFVPFLALTDTLRASERRWLRESLALRR